MGFPSGRDKNRGLTDMEAPVKQLLKKEIIWLSEHKCKHRHTYLSHYNCFLLENPEDSPFYEKVGFFDIEASNLDADFGYCFSYAIKERGKGILGRVLTPQEIRNYAFDKKLLKELCVDLRKFHRIVVHWGIDRRFDLPFVRTRALKYGFEFPLYKEIYAEDTYSMAKAKLKLSRNRLENICDFFGIPSKEHKLNPNVWQKALAGDKKSLEYIWTHNKEDVVSLELVYEKLRGYTLKGKRSI